jgi:hypothetical protein
MFPELFFVSCWYRLNAKALFPLTKLESWLAVVSDDVILDSLDFATSNDTGSGVCVVVTGVVVTGVVITGVVECGCVVFVVVFVHPAALTSIIAAIMVKIIFFIFKPRLFVTLATIITSENEIS